MNYINEEEMIELRRTGFTWSYIAEKFGVSRKTLYEFRRERNLLNIGTEVNDDVLDEVVSKIAENYPNSGEVIIAGLLLANELSVPRQQLRDSLHRVDAVGVARRRIGRIERRVYMVAGPDHLWHMDGHHKLIKFGLVTHGCIDGFSRLITYLKCSNNNRSRTVYELFQHAAEQYGYPSRVRGDRGGENVLVAEKMNQVRGEGRGSFLAGPSKFNTRIERLWRDVMSSVIVVFKERFERYEEEGLKHYNPVHIFCLQHMFLPLINQHLEVYVQSWNNHKISTEGNRTARMLRSMYANQVPPPVEVEEDYGFHEDELEAAGDAAAVEVPNLHCPLLPAEIIEVQERCPALHINENPINFDNLFMNCLNVVTEIINR